MGEGGSEVKIILWLKLVVYRHTNKPVKKNFKKINPGRFGGPTYMLKKL